MKRALHFFLGVVVIASFGWMLIVGLVTNDLAHQMTAVGTFMLSGLGMSLCE
jgi:hypothetical protein